MKTRQWISGMVALSALLVAGTSFAGPEMRDGEDLFSDFKSTKSRAEVRSEMEAVRAQSVQRSDRIASDRDIGARGVAGARYSGRTRDQVHDELIQHQKTNNPYSPDYLYFGG